MISYSPPPVVTTFALLPEISTSFWFVLRVYSYKLYWATRLDYFVCCRFCLHLRNHWPKLFWFSLPSVSPTHPFISIAGIQCPNLDHYYIYFHHLTFRNARNSRHLYSMIMFGFTTATLSLRTSRSLNIVDLQPHDLDFLQIQQPAMMQMAQPAMMQMPMQSYPTVNPTAM